MWRAGPHALHRLRDLGENSGNFMSQAFISYHHAQRKLARLIAHRVAADGHSVWWDRSDRPGDEWSEAVSSALARSACVVVIWSKQAAASPAILGEATAGYGRNALINVMADKTAPPPPFNNAPIVDLQDWAGDSIDVAWIRLRDPIRAKMQDAEVKHVEGQALPPHRPPPQIAPPRASFQAPHLNLPPLNLPPPAPIYEERRSGGAGSALMVLALAGLAAGGWYYRDELRQEASRWQAALEPQTEVAAIPPAPERLPEPTLASAAPLTPVDATTPVEPVEPTLEDAPPAATLPSMAVASLTPTSAPAPRFEDTWVPPPVIRQLPRSAPVADPPFSDGPAVQPAAVHAAPPAPAAPAAHRINLRQGRFVDIDAGDPQRQTDIWFAPDKSGDGLYLGVTNGARMRTVPLDRATDAECNRSGAVMRRTPIAARDLARGMGVCVRTSANRVRVVHVEGIAGAGQEKILRLRLSPVAGT